jgi:outer membrane murein-binding lipoprotein Lpp
MNTDEKILKALEDLQAGQNTLQADVKGLKSDVTAIKDVQQKQGKRLETLEAGQQTLDHKVEAIHAYQKQAHNEIMEHLIESNEIAGRDQKILEKRIERIEKHLGLPPLK